MSKIGLIIQREYTTRVKKKSFIIMTLLGPLLGAGIVAIPTLLDNSKNVHRHIVVVDGTHSFCGTLKDDATVSYDFRYCDNELGTVRKMFSDSSKVSVMYIKPTEQAMEIQLELYSKADPGVEVISDIEFQVNNNIEKAKMRAENLDEKLIEQVKSKVGVKNIVGDTIANSDYNLGLAVAGGLLIYIFIFLYSVQVMRGVMEEKVSRIVEVIISSVKPFQLMMGKVIGVGLVGLTQFIAWMVLGYFAISIESRYAQSQAINPDNYKQTEQTVKQGMPEDKDNTYVQLSKNGGAAGAMLKFEEALGTTNWPLEITCFLFYFLGGYLLYSALFAAIGSAVDQETDSQQFMLPVTAPLILSYVVMLNIVRDPHSSMAFWFSIFPLTSPIAMMARIPFGISVWELALSMMLLIGSIFGAVWLAGRIYRVGLLMYGKKVTYKELGKWLFYK